MAQEALFRKRGEGLSALLSELPTSLDELGDRWARGGTSALCVPPPESGEAVETLPGSEWNAILSRRARGACIQLTGCEVAFPALAAFMEELKTELNLGKETEATASIFMARAGSGFPRHRDSKDVWIIGLAGLKTVRTAAAASVGPDHRLSIDDPPLPMPPGSKRHTLSRGDVLYIPRGCWHATHARTAETFSVSVGLTRPWRAELMVAELLEVLSRDPRWRRPIESCDEAIPAQLVQELAGWMVQRTWSSGSSAVVDDETYVRNHGARLSLVGGKLHVESCGELTRLTVSSELDLAAFVEFLQANETVTAERVRRRFSHLEHRACASLLTLLSQGGFLRRA